MCECACVCACAWCVCVCMCLSERHSCIHLGHSITYTHSQQMTKTQTQTPGKIILYNTMQNNIAMYYYAFMWKIITLVGLYSIQLQNLRSSSIIENPSKENSILGLAEDAIKPTSSLRGSVRSSSMIMSSVTEVVKLKAGKMTSKSSSGL